MKNHDIYSFNFKFYTFSPYNAFKNLIFGKKNLEVSGPALTKRCVVTKKETLLQYVTYI